MIKIRKKYLFYTIATISSIIAAAVISIDTYISNILINNPWILCLSAFLAGTVITFLISLILSIPIKGKVVGSFIDPSFKGLRLLKKEEVKYHIMAGMGNSVTTFAYFYIIWLYKDPSAILSFYQIVILYLLIIEWVAEKNAPTLAEVESSTIVAFGAVLASLSLHGQLNLLGLAVVFLILNPSWAIFSIYQRKLKIMKIDNSYNDSINIRFWNLIFTTVFTLILIELLDIFMKTDYLLQSIKAIHYWDWLFLSMGVTFFSYILYIRALGLGKASVTQAVTASKIIFIIPFSLILAPVIKIVVFESPLHALIKIIGMALVVMGVISFALTEVKGYIFINARSGYKVEEILEKIWKIKGITNVAAVAGSYDIIAKARIRTLGKGYERIVRLLEDINEISSFKWQSILKEWEEI